MNNNDNILIQNIYHMLSYAFRILNTTTYDHISGESFENIHNLFAAILAKGMSVLLKQGMYQEYINKNESLKTLRGKINLSETIRHRSNQKQLLSCEFDTLTVNNIYNQLIKTTAILLLKFGTLDNSQRESLRKVIVYYSEIDSIEINQIKWNQVKFHRNNQHYKLLLNICYFVLNDLLITEQKGEYKLNNYMDDQRMSSIFERFILEYYRYHHKYLNVNASKINWDIEEDSDIKYLPEMKTDITLSNKNKILIIDTKYYSRSMSANTQFNSQTYHSNNLYQIFSYVKNANSQFSKTVSGMLLYAKTNESVTPNSKFTIGGNDFYVKSIDLNTHFSSIQKQLDDYAQYVVT